VYGKVFDSIYDGTLYGNWEAIATFQQLIVLANADGIVDMTPQAIAARTSFPLDLIQRGIKFLEAPDPYSRTPGDEGRRIALIDEHRPWGWRIVNHGKYKGLRDMAQKREADRLRISEKRKKNKACRHQCRRVSRMSPMQMQMQIQKTMSAHNANEVRVYPRRAPTAACSSRGPPTSKQAAIYQPVNGNIALTAARLREGATVEARPRRLSTGRLATGAAGKWTKFLVKRTGPNNWLACCPAHEDKSPSFTLHANPDGRILANCFSGCSFPDIVRPSGSVGSRGFRRSKAPTICRRSSTHSLRPTCSKRWPTRPTSCASFFTTAIGACR
jgi:hypothetical protein